MIDKLKKILNNIRNSDVSILDTDRVTSRSSDIYIPGGISLTIIDVSPNLYLVSKAARVCINKPVDESIEERKKYVKRLAEMGHESPLEHSNIIAVISATQEYYPTFMYIMENDKYVNTYISASDGKVNLLIGGSIRGFLHIMREFNNKNPGRFKNSVVEFPNGKQYAEDIISKLLYETTEREFLYDLIKLEFLDSDKCTYEPVADIDTNNSYEDGELVDSEAIVIDIRDPKYIKGERVDLVYSQDVEDICERIKPFGFDIDDAGKVCTISFMFHDVSRSCANQMTRHRVAISQESLRYCKVDVTNTSNFIDPIEMQREGRYKDLEDCIQENIVDEINQDIFTPYSRLINVGIVKEDARAWLPMNVSTKLMMTFTYRQALQFIGLRSSKGAQYEIRLVAEEMKSYIEERFFIERLDFSIQYPAFIRDLIPKTDNSSTSIDSDKVDDDIQTTMEEMKPLNISTPESAKAYMETHEEFKKIKEEDI